MHGEGGRLTQAMAAAEKQEKRSAQKPPRTPKRKPEEVKVIGSSCTWGDEELGRFKVTVTRDVNPRELIPQQFFDFSNIANYESCNSMSSVVFLTLGKSELCALSKLDIRNKKVISAVRNSSHSLFDSLRQVALLQSEVRQSNLSQKRKSINIQSESEILATETSTDVGKETVMYGTFILACVAVVDSSQAPSVASVASSSKRIVSGASISGPQQDSAGGSRVLSSNEKASDMFANIFMGYVISWIWPDGVKLEWVEGREGETTLDWNNSYVPF